MTLAHTRTEEAEENKKRKMLTSSKQPWYWRMPHHDDNEAKLYELSTTDSLYQTVKQRFFYDPINCTHPHLVAHMRGHRCACVRACE
jgi:hypothetical protein